MEVIAPVSETVMASLPNPEIVPAEPAAYAVFISASVPVTVVTPIAVITPVVRPLTVLRSAAETEPVSEIVTVSFPKPATSAAVLAS